MEGTWTALDRSTIAGCLDWPAGWPSLFNTGADARGTTEDAAWMRTAKVSSPLNSAVILARWLNELDANPDSVRELGDANKPHCAEASIVEFDLLTNEPRCTVARVAHICGG